MTIFAKSFHAFGWLATRCLPLLLIACSGCFWRGCERTIIERDEHGHRIRHDRRDHKEHNDRKEHGRVIRRRGTAEFPEVPEASRGRVDSTLSDRVRRAFGDASDARADCRRYGAVYLVTAQKVGAGV